MENAAHAHCCALLTLLRATTSEESDGDEKVVGAGAITGSSDDCGSARAVARTAAGRAFNITNCDPQRSVEMWEEMLAVCAADSQEPQRKAPQLTCLPKALLWVVAVFLELTFALLAGRVPLPRAAVWNLTRRSLDFATTSATFATGAASAIGYRPRFSNRASFKHIRMLREQQAMGR